MYHPDCLSLTGSWRFAIDPEKIGETFGWATADFNDSAWREVIVPHTWNVMPDYSPYEGIAWYRHAFFCPPGASAAHIRLRFDAVFYLSRVWLNGHYLGVHEGGYTPFEFNIDDHVKPGSENVIAMQVDNERSTDRLPAHLYEGRSYGWNNYGGIVRDVRLLLTSRTFIVAQRLVTEPHLTDVNQADRASILVAVTLRNTSDKPFTGRLSAEIFEESNGQSVVVVTPTHLFDLAPDQTMVTPLEASLSTPKLWHFDHPDLYRWSTCLLDASGQEVNHDQVVFGVRKVELKENRFYLNGEPVRLAGLSRHASVPGYGLAETESVMSNAYDDLKRLNMVIGRPVHYPQHEFIYDYCDRKGILLSPELPAWQLTAGQMSDEHMRALAKQQLAEMVAAAANHPCVWAWSVGNELESDTVAGRAYVHDMVEYVKSLDPTRPVGFASYHLLVGRPWGDATRHSDFVMMNQYFGTWHGPKDSLGVALDTIHLTWPEKTVIISEFGFAPHWERIEGPARKDATQYYYIDEGAPVDSPEADVQRQRVIRDQMATFRTRPFVAAATFWDYRGGMGVVDDLGRPRPSWNVLQEEFAPLLIEGADFTFPRKDQCRVNVKLHTRGPLETDLPAYTLRNYRITWEILSPAGKPLDLRGEAELPVLPPGTKYNLAIEIPRLEKRSELHISVIRPTGFIVIDRRFNAP